MPDGERPNILVIWGDDIGIDSYGEQSCKVDVGLQPEDVTIAEPTRR